MKTIVTIIAVLFYANLAAQTTYYYDRDWSYMVPPGNIQYDCHVEPSGMVKLFAGFNRHTNEEQTYIDERPLDKEFYNSKRSDFIVSDTWTDYKIASILRNSFSEEEKKRLKGYNLGIAFYINSKTGKVDDIEFYFMSVHPFATIPPSTYRKIDEELKREIWFTLTPKAKELNYLIQYWQSGVN